MDLINGRVYLLFYQGNLLSNVNKDGINGWIHLSKKLNGQEIKMKNYYNWLVCFQVSGEQLLHLLEEHLLNVMRGIKNY